MAASMQNVFSSCTLLSSSSHLQKGKKAKNPYSNCSWLQNRLIGQHGSGWRRARLLQLLNKNYSKKLSWFKVNRSLSSDESSKKKKKKKKKNSVTLVPDDLSDESKYFKRITWCDDSYHSLLKLLYTIVNQWQPHLMDEDQNYIENNLHSILIPERCLKPVRIIYGNEGPDGEKTALRSYLNALVPLHYHELWASIIRDYHSPEITFEERKITIDDVKVSYEQNLDIEEELTVINGKTRIIFNDSFAHMNNRLSLFDLVVISIDQREYFGVVICVKQTQTKEAQLNTIEALTTTPDFKPIKIELEMMVSIYVSNDCGNAIARQAANGTSQLNLIKVTNITSMARMISAIHKLEMWPRYMNLLRPNVDDPYFQSPKNTEDNLSTEEKLKGFNKKQRQIINGVEKIFDDDEQDRLSIVVGPPGTGKSCTIAGCVLKLLPKLYKGHKLLICAPSNGACDELMRRILDQFKYQGIPYDNNTLLRIGGVPPDDESLCEYFHEFRILSRIFELIRAEPKRTKFNIYEIGKRIINNAKIVLTTLNHCASSRMQLLEGRVDFIIIDEACQSLEADCLNAFRFGCTKIMLVGDPNQLPPTVMSKAGQMQGLDKSLYDRLYENFIKSQSNPIIMLNVQYRMHRDICEFPSHCFYNSTLITPPSVDKRSPNFPLRRVYFYNLANSTEMRNRDGSKRNEKEALAVERLCHMLIAYLHQYKTKSNCSLDIQSEIARSIAIMTPYKDQVRYFQNLQLPSGIEVMTVDGAQGKEKDIVIYSCVRNNDEDIGFLKDERRLNVALTRAKEGLYVIGNLKQFAKQPKNEFWAKMVRYAQSDGRNIIEDVDYDALELPIIIKT